MKYFVMVSCPGGCRACPAPTAGTVRCGWPASAAADSSSSCLIGRAGRRLRRDLEHRSPLQAVGAAQPGYPALATPRQFRLAHPIWPVEMRTTKADGTGRPAPGPAIHTGRRAVHLGLEFTVRDGQMLA